MIKFKYYKALKEPMDGQLLEEIGLTKSETKVYLALLELGSTTTGKIVDKSRASSSKIYEILDRLMQKGLASFIIKEGIKHFEAASPERILDYLEEKEKNFQKQKKDIKKILPELELKRTISKHKSEATVYKGIKGGETAFKYMINSMKKDDEWLGFVVSFPQQKYFDSLTKIHSWRAEKGLKSRLIFNENYRKNGEIREKTPLTKVKYVSDEYQTPAIINIAGNITLLNIMGEETIIFLIESKQVADSFRNQFEKIWNQDIIIHKGFDQVTERFDNLLEELGEKDKYYVIGGHLTEAGDNMRKWLLDFHTRRVKKKVSAKFLVSSETKEFVNYELTHTGDPEMKLAEVKELPKEYQNPMQINLFKDNRVFVFLEFKEPMFFEIQSESLYKTFKTQFDTLWNQDTSIVKSLDAIQDIFEEMLEAGSCDFIAARGYFMDERPKFIDDWEKIAIEKGFKMRNIVDKETKGHRITNFPFARTKYTLPKEFANLSVIWIFGKKIVIANWVEKEPVAVIINNENLYNMYKTQFEFLWNKKII